jgi:ribokinase
MPEVVVVGSYVQDLAFTTESFPLPGETRIGTFASGPGGKGFNQAIACHRQKVRTVFLGAIGNDSFGRDITRFVEDEKLDARFQKVSAPTGAASIVINAQGQNSIVVSLGANAELEPSFIQKHKQAISKASVVVSQLESNIEATKTAFSLARDASVLTILNPAPISKTLSAEVLSLADVIVPNESEFLFLCESIFGKSPRPDIFHNADVSLTELCRELPVQTVVITLGEKGVFVCHNKQTDINEKEDRHYRIDAIGVEVVDTSGAGDAFIGGLAAGLIRFPDSFKCAISYANVVAGLSTEKRGTAPAMPYKSEVETVFNQEFSFEEE